MKFLALRGSYTARLEIQFAFTAFSCPVVVPVRRADWRQALPGGNDRRAHDRPKEPSFFVRAPCSLHDWGIST